MTAPLSEQQLAEIRARVDCVEPGPWAVEYDGCDCNEGCMDQLAVGFGPFTSVENAHRDVTPEAEFAAAAREDVPALLAEVERLRTASGVERIWYRHKTRMERKERVRADRLLARVRELEQQLAAAVRRDVTGPLRAIVEHSDMSETVRREIADLLGDAEGGAA